MNRIRRAKLNKIAEQIEELKSLLEEIMEEEEECRDNIPENMQSGSRYERAEEICDSLSDAIDCMDEAVSNICDAGE